MNYNEVKELINIIDNSSLRVFEITIDNVNVKMSKNEHNNSVSAAYDSSSTTNAFSAPAASVQDISKDSASETPINSGTVVKAPIVGTFYKSSGGKNDAFAIKDKAVKKGDILCIIEAMKIMNEIVSPCDGTVAEIFVENEDFVEYGQELFRIV